MALHVRKSPLKQRMAVVVHPDLRAFLIREPDIRRKIEEFAAGYSKENSICIAGPLSAEEMLVHIQEPDRPVSLPCITIEFDVKTYDKTGERYCYIAASDADIETVKGWNRQLALGPLAPRARLGMPV